MAINHKHPAYTDLAPDWVKLSDIFKGSSHIKSKGEQYLPPTQSMILDGMRSSKDLGYQNYQAYKSRAMFHDLYRDAVGALVGVAHRKAPTITVPDNLKPFIESMTVNDEDGEALLRKINQEQLKTGRYGLLVDVPSGQGPDALPFVATYTGTSVINWGTRENSRGVEELEFVVLDESEFELTHNLSWELNSKYRVLVLSGDVGQEKALLPADGENIVPRTYYTATFDEKQEFASGAFFAPTLGGKTLEYIPFFFVNVNDMVPNPDVPPLLALGNTVLAIYRGEADYRQALYMQTQETLVIIGGGNGSFHDDGNPGESDEERRIGAGSSLELPMGGDAKYVGVSGNGLSEMRQALENDKKMAAEQGAKLLDGSGDGGESGAALRIRVASRTANLSSIVKTGAAALEGAIRVAAEWRGMTNLNEITVEPNLDFVDDQMTGRSLLEFMQARAMGAPISKKTIHNLMRHHELTDLDYENEITLIEEEGSDDGTTPPGFGGNRGA